MTRLDKVQLLELKEDQLRLLDSQEKLKQKQQVFDDDNQVLIGHIQDLQERIAGQKDTLREVAEVEYKETMNKQLLGGLGVRVSYPIEYNEEKAFEWAKEHNLCIQLDRKAFEHIAKAQPLGFVTKQEKVTITFPKSINFDK